MIVEGVMTEVEQESHSKTFELLLLRGFQYHKHVPVLFGVSTLCCFALLSLTLSFHFSSLFPVSFFFLLSFHYALWVFLTLPLMLCFLWAYCIAFLARSVVNLLKKFEWSVRILWPLSFSHHFSALPSALLPAQKCSNRDGCRTEGNGANRP